MDIVQLVAQPTWREFLVELVSTQQMDPWDVDVGTLADAYLSKVKELQALDLRVPANVILASAILLYFKASALRLEEEEEVYQQTLEETPLLLDQNIPDLVYRATRPRTRRVTLQELLTAMDKVLKEGPRRLMNAATPKALSIELPPESMEDRMRRVLNITNELKDSEGVVLFSNVVSRVLREPKPQRAIAMSEVSTENAESGGYTQQIQARNAGASNEWGKGEAFVYCLLPILHLSQEEKLFAWQDDTFGEIFIKLN